MLGLSGPFEPQNAAIWRYNNRVRFQEDIGQQRGFVTDMRFHLVPPIEMPRRAIRQRIPVP